MVLILYAHGTLVNQLPRPEPFKNKQIKLLLRRPKLFLRADGPSHRQVPIEFTADFSGPHACALMGIGNKIRPRDKIRQQMMDNPHRKGLPLVLFHKIRRELSPDNLRAMPFIPVNRQRMKRFHAIPPCIILQNPVRQLADPGP